MTSLNLLEKYFYYIIMHNMLEEIQWINQKLLNCFSGMALKYLIAKVLLWILETIVKKSMRIFNPE